MVILQHLMNMGLDSMSPAADDTLVQLRNTNADVLRFQRAVDKWSTDSYGQGGVMSSTLPGEQVEAAKEFYRGVEVWLGEWMAFHEVSSKELELARATPLPFLDKFKSDVEKKIAEGVHGEKFKLVQWQHAFAQAKAGTLTAQGKLTPTQIMVGSAIALGVIAAGWVMIRIGKREKEKVEVDALVDGDRTSSSAPTMPAPNPFAEHGMPAPPSSIAVAKALIPVRKSRGTFPTMPWASRESAATLPGGPRSMVPGDRTTVPYEARPTLVDAVNRAGLPPPPAPLPGLDMRMK